MPRHKSSPGLPPRASRRAPLWCARLPWRHFAKFVVAGTISQVPYYVGLYVLTSRLGVWYLTSSLAAQALRMLVKFVLQKFWTFDDRTYRWVPIEISVFVFTELGFIGANTALLYLLVSTLGIEYLVAQVAIMLGLGLLSFLVCRWLFWVKTFARRR